MDNSQKMQIVNFNLQEAKRLATIEQTKTTITEKKFSQYSIKRIKLSDNQKIKPGMQRLIRFQQLLDLLRTCPKANKEFKPNNYLARLWTYALLYHIVGPEYYADEKNQLMRQVNSPERCKNVLTVTSRQQGKTYMLGFFLAAVMCLSPLSGALCDIYSNGLKGSKEILLTAKSYLRWLHEIGYEYVPKKYTKMTEEAVELTTCYGNKHVTWARPKTEDSNRGNHPEFFLYDEAAFGTHGFFINFLYPLLSIGTRVCIAATTPPPPDNYFFFFIAKTKALNAKGKNLFRLIDFSLKCERCTDKGTAQRCTHRLALIPPWKSIAKIKNMQEFMSTKDMRAFEQEVYGMIDDNQGFYIHQNLIRRAAELERVTSPDFGKKEVLYIAVDPPSHQNSSMGIASLIQQKDGTSCFVGLDEMPAMKSETIQIQSMVATHIKAIRALPQFARIAIVPIIECNNNDIMANSILQTFRRFPPIVMPFTRSYFDKEIYDGIGVRTGAQNKHAMMSMIQTNLLKDSIRFMRDGVCVGIKSHNPTAPVPRWDEMVKLTLTELGQFRDMPDGSISGKLASGATDDVAMAVCMAMYWYLTVKALQIL